MSSRLGFRLQFAYAAGQNRQLRQAVRAQPLRRKGRARRGATVLGAAQVSRGAAGALMLPGDNGRSAAALGRPEYRAQGALRTCREVFFRYCSRDLRIEVEGDLRMERARAVSGQIQPAQARRCAQLAVAFSGAWRGGDATALRGRQAPQGGDCDKESPCGGKSPPPCQAIPQG